MYVIKKDKKFSKLILASSAAAIVVEILVTFYSFLGLFELVPISLPIFALLLVILLFTNTLMFVLAIRNNDKIGVRSAIALILWVGLVVGFWICAPIYYLISMHIDTLQLRWVVFAFVWEVPLIGGALILFVLFLFRPIHRFLQDKSSDIDVESIYRRIQSFPILVGVSVFVAVTLGYIIGTMQQKYFANMSPIEQWKNALNGGTLSLLVGTSVSLLMDLYFNRLRAYINRQHNFSSKTHSNFTLKITISMMVIIFTGIGMTAMLSYKSAQEIIRGMIIGRTVEDFQKVMSLNWRAMTPEEKEQELSHMKRGTRGNVFIEGTDNLDMINLLDSNRDYIQNNESGIVDDYQFDLKTVIFDTNPITDEKIVSVVYLSDYYDKISAVAGLAILGYVFVIITVAGTIIFYKRSISIPLALLLENVKPKREGDDFQVSTLTTGDEFEELSDAMMSYKYQIKKANQELKTKIEEQTAQMSLQLEEIEKKNVFLEDTKKAVLNILEDTEEIENKLKKNNEELNKFQLAVEEANDHIIITDSKGIILYANRSVEKITGYSVREALGKTAGDLWGGHMQKDYYNKMWHTIAIQKKPFSGEVINRRKNGEEYSAELYISPILNSKKEVDFFVGIERDITDEKESKAFIERTVEERTRDLKEKTKALESAKDEISRGWLHLQEEQARLTASINSLPKGFVITDLEKNVITANIHVGSILGMNEKIWTIQKIQDKLEKGIDISTMLDKSIRTKKNQTIEELQMGEKFLRISVLPVIQNHSQKCIGSVLLIEDISEEKVLARSRDEFFSIASHELRTPLTSIRGNTSLIQQYYSDILKDKSLKEMIDDIYESSTRLIQIVNDFLDVSRIEQGRLEYKIEKVDIGKLAEEVVQELKSSAEEKGIELKMESRTKEKYANADRDRSKQVIVNLIGNAIKYTEAGSVKVLIESSHARLSVKVVDTGRGIPLESRSLLFRKFQQASNNLFTRDTTKGTGLGLYISTILARGMKGDVELLKSEVGKGSTFVFWLPIAYK